MSTAPSPSASRRLRAVRGAPLALAAVLIISALGVAPPAQAEPGVAACSVEYLRLPHGGRHSFVEASDPTGRWLAGYADPDTDTIVVWDGGDPTELRPPYYYLNSGGINRHGDVVGTGRPQSGDDSSGFAYVDGTLVELGPPPDTTAVAATGISSAGVISGYATRADGRTRAWVWSADEPDSPRRLRLPHGSSSRAVGISANGHAAVYQFAPTDRSFVFGPGGRRTELAGSEPRFRVRVWDIANGWAAGTERDPSTGESHVIRWNLDSGAVEIIPPGLTYPAALNSHGHLAGSVSGDAVLFTDHYISLPPKYPEDGTHADALSDRGIAAGYEVDVGFVSAVRWDCSE